ncbi:MAG: Smr/MutS family protein [Alphaproteobacteria bacterium]|nr:Smr/MutS family protein [Alphaproteobacteria bacterium]
MKDEDLWKTYAQGVKPLTDKTPPAKKTPAKEQQKKETLLKEEASRQAASLSKLPPVPAPTKSHIPRQALDSRIKRNMTRGEVLIEARLDLHAMTEQEAYEAFYAFIHQQHDRGRRMLLIITGKGADGSCALKTNLPRWSETAPFDEKILALRPAAPHHGGAGAYYVLLRKNGNAP